jgi:hypothetical protein
MDSVADHIFHPIPVLSPLLFRIGADHHHWKTNESSGSKDNPRQPHTETRGIQKHILLDVHSDKDVKGPGEDALQAKKGGPPGTTMIP